MSAYQDLVARVADQEPRNGFSNISQITLTDEDLATVIAHEPDVISDALNPTTGYIEANVRWALGEAPTREQANTRLAEVLRSCLAVEAKTLVLIDAQDECARRAMVRSIREKAARRGDGGSVAYLENYL